MNASYFQTICACGRTREVRGDKLRNGRITSCAECTIQAAKDLRKPVDTDYSLRLTRSDPIPRERRIIPIVTHSLEALKAAAQLSASQMLASGVSAAIVRRYLAIPTSVIPNP